MSADARDKILARVRAALEPLAERAKLPDYDTDIMVTLRAGVDLWAHFCERLKAVNGRAMESVGALAEFLKEKGWTRGYCDPALQSTVGEKLGEEFVVEYEFDRARMDDFQFGITKATGAIAESGTIVINDAETSSRLGALAPWAHITVLDPETLWPDIPTALKNLGDDPNTIWITGPSKTADVEGILIEGVHGPGEQICLRFEMDVEG